MSLPPNYSIRRNGQGYDLWHSHYGLLVEECDTYGGAEDHAHEDAAERAANAAPDEDLASAVADLLHVIDRDGLTRHLSVGLGEDRCEIAALRSVRSALARAEKVAA